MYRPGTDKEPDTLGERLKKRREELGLSLETIARETKSPARSIRALEEDDFGYFSAKIYALGILRKILAALPDDPKEEFMAEFNNEWEVRNFRNKKELIPLPENRSREPYITPRKLGLAGGTVLLAALLLFLGFRFVRFIGPPILLVEEPGPETSTSEPMVRVKGRTEKESQLTVNGRELRIDENGNFNEEIELAAGLNALEFWVQDRFGKVNKEVRYILVK